MYKKLPVHLQDEVVEKIELFRHLKNHEALEVRKLKGRMKGYYGFSIDFRNRVVFEYISDYEVAFLVVGDHKVYE